MMRGRKSVDRGLSRGRTRNRVAAICGSDAVSSITWRMYQFFPNKEAILDALVDRYLDELQRAVFVQEEQLPITTHVERILDRLARFHESHAGFRALFLDTDIEHRIHRVLIQLIETDIGQYFSALDADLCRQTAMAWL